MKIRKGVFETNSSSTHSIAIAKDKVNNLAGRFISFHIGEYGWSEGEYSFPDYMYTALLDNDDMESLDKLKSILDKWGVKYKFEKPIWRFSTYNGKDYRYLDYGYIDHCCEALPIMREILNDEDLLARALFGDSTVYTGNDNGSDYFNMCYCADKKIWDDETNSYIPNPNNDSEHYDFFFKGN